MFICAHDEPVHQRRGSMKGRVQRIVDKAKSGNKKAFNQLVEMYQDRVLFVAYDLLGDWDEAKDVGQETFIRAYEKLKDFQGKAHFSSWIYRIAVNLCMDVHRRKKRAPLDSLDADTENGFLEMKAQPEAFTSHFSSSLELAELRKQLDKALQHLSLNQRTAIVLRYFHERSTREIAEIMDCNENTVRIHFFRAMEKLKESLKELKNS
jgi:RNA polymerase sigma-70 factor (ECF subfamily)